MEVLPIPFPHYEEHSTRSGLEPAVNRVLKRTQSLETDASCFFLFFEHQLTDLRTFFLKKDDLLKRTLILTLKW